MNDMENKLLSIWDKVNDWLKFAEAKNAGILVFSGAAIAALLGFLGSSFKFQSEWKIGFLTGVIFLSISCLLAIWSFIPKTKIVFRNYGQPADNDNLFFYGHLCKYSPQQLVDAIGRLYFNNNQHIANRSDLVITATEIYHQRHFSYHLMTINVPANARLFTTMYLLYN